MAVSLSLNLPGATLAGTNYYHGHRLPWWRVRLGVLTVASNAVVTGLAGTSQGALTVAGGATVSWTNSGTYTGSFTVLTNGVLTLDWTVLTSWNGALANAGTVNIHGIGQLNLTGGPINNLPGGIIDFKTNQIWTGFPAATFSNAGLLRKTGGTGISEIGYPSYPISFTNTGTVEADTGTIIFDSGGQIDGNYQVASNATINFALGTFTAINPVFSGAGTNKFTGTSLTLSNNIIPGLQLAGGSLNLGPAFQGGTITNLNLPGATLAGTNISASRAPLLLGGGFHWRADGGTAMPW